MLKIQEAEGKNRKREPQSDSPVTLGKATHLRFPPSSPSSPSPPPLLSRCALSSAVRWRRLRLAAAAPAAMHIKTTKCNRFCLVASVANQEVFNRPEAQVKKKKIIKSRKITQDVEKRWTRSTDRDDVTVMSSAVDFFLFIYLFSLIHRR